VKPEPLIDAELERLSAILERFGGKRSMNLEQLDGFIAALVCGPDIILPSEYLPEIGDTISSLKTPSLRSLYYKTSYL
jgi:uncharacterized protein